MRNLYTMKIKEAQRCVNMQDISKLKSIILELDRSFQEDMKYLTERLVSRSITQDEFNEEISEMRGIQDFLKEKLSFLETNFDENKYELSYNDKKQIYHLYHSGRYSQKDLSNMYNVTQPYISKIVNDHQKYGMFK